jgi:hypothetical protein
VIKLAGSRPAAKFTARLAASAGVPDPGIRWRLCEGPYFDNQVATLKLEDQRASMKLEKVPRDPQGRDERLELVFQRRLS